MDRVFYLFAGRLKGRGLELVAREQLRALSEAGIGVDLMARSDPGIPGVETILWRHTPANLLSWLPSQHYYCSQFRFFSMIAARHLRRNAGRYTACVCWNRQAVALAPAARAAGVPVLLNHPSWHHDYPPGQSGWKNHGWPRFTRRDFDHQYEQSDRILVTSALARETFTHFGIPGEKVVSIGRGVDLEEFDAPERPHHPFRAVFAGELSDRKGILQALDAWREAAIPGGEFWLLGHLPHEMEEAVRARLDASVKLLGFQKDVAALMRQCHVQLMPTRKEGLPKALIEGAACGLATLTTAESGFPVTEGVTGYLIHRDDPSTTAGHLRNLSADADRWRAMSRAAAADAREHHSWESFRSRFIREVRTCIASRTKGPV